MAKSKSPTFIHKVQMEDTSLCDRLINYFHTHDEYKGRGSATGGISDKHGTHKISTDLSIALLSSNDPNIQAYNQHLISAAQSYMQKYDHLKSAMDIYNFANIQHYQPGEGYFNWHCERNLLDETKRSLVFMTYLNDVTDGGETEFYYQGVKVKPKKGLTLLWPTDFTHTHRGVVSPTQEKYILTGWFEWASVAAIVNTMNMQFKQQQ